MRKFEPSFFSLNITVMSGIWVTYRRYKDRKPSGRIGLQGTFLIPTQSKSLVHPTTPWLEPFTPSSTERRNPTIG